MRDVRKQKRAVRILAFVQLLSCFDSFIDMSHSSFILMHLAVEQLQPETLEKKKSSCNLRGFGFFFSMLIVGVREEVSNWDLECVGIEDDLM